MLPRGTIWKIHEFYYTEPKFRGELMRAMREFFDRPDLDRGGSLEMEEYSERFFNEWFMYDFVLEKGQTPLEYFCENNPFNFSTRKMLKYRDLQTNEFGLWEVLEVYIGKGVEVANLQTGNKYEVEDRTSSFVLKRGSLLFNRVGKAGDHFEFVGADSFYWPISKLDKRTRNLFAKEEDKLSPKVVHKILKEYANSLVLR